MRPVAILKPTRETAKRMGILYGERVRAPRGVDRVVEDTIAIDALARTIEQAIELTTSADGRVDMRDVAAYVLARMKEHPL